MQRRPAYFPELTDADRVIVERALTDLTQSRRVRERLEMVKGAALGWDVATLAAWSGRTEAVVRHWIGVYEAEGLAALSDAPRSGRPAKADDAYLAALAAAVESDPRGLGQGFDVWTSSRLSAYLTQTTGTRIAPGWLRVLLHREGFANGRPKHTVAHLQDPAEVATCEDRLREVGEKGGRAPGTVRSAF